MSGGVILNNPRQQPHDLTLILPTSVVEERVPFRCTLCGARFTRHQAARYESHVGKCAREHIDEIRANAPSARNKGTVWDPEAFDPEVDEHLLKMGRRMIAERRLELRPHERAGG